VEYTPENIRRKSDLPENAVFVFGSNLAGRHGAGAALLAKEEFGAQYGNGWGLTGSSYAFPTLGRNFEKLSIERLTSSAITFYDCVRRYPDKLFYLTKVGLGLAGYDISEIAPLFTQDAPNLIKPQEFVEFNQEN